MVFTDPEIAWCGLTEAEAKAANRDGGGGEVPVDGIGPGAELRPDRRHDEADHRSRERAHPRGGIVGAGAGELIGEAVVAMEMGATAYDLSQSVHPHPTLSETLMECAEAFYGHATHVMGKKKA